MKTAILWKLSMGVSAVLLAACGSSGGGAVVMPHHGSSSSSHGKTATTTSGGKQAATPATNSAEWGGVQTRTVENRTNHSFTEFGKSTQVSGSSLDKVTINGKEVTLLDNGIVSGNWYRAETPGVEKVIHGGYKYTRFGAYTFESDKAEDINLIAHGQLTPAADVPTTGTVSYTGHAIYEGDGVPTNLNWAEGTSKFDVDFGKKTISGQVAIPDVNNKTIDLKGTISGNSFAGVQSGTTMQGHFFGPKAEELSGTFHKGTVASPEFIGAFGAKK